MDDLGRLPAKTASRILAKIEGMAFELGPQVKRLTNFDPPFRLRVGDYRVLFDVDERMTRVQAVVHRKDAYD